MDYNRLLVYKRYSVLLSISIIKCRLNIFVLPNFLTQRWRKRYYWSKIKVWIKILIIIFIFLGNVLAPGVVSPFQSPRINSGSQQHLRSRPNRSYLYIKHIHISYHCLQNKIKTVANSLTALILNLISPLFLCVCNY